MIQLDAIRDDDTNNCGAICSSHFTRNVTCQLTCSQGIFRKEFFIEMREKKKQKIKYNSHVKMIRNICCNLLVDDFWCLIYMHGMYTLYVVNSD